MKNFTIYEHITPSGKRYIGITSKKPEDRWRKGEGYNQKGQQCFYNAIKKYCWDNIQHNILFNDLTEKEAKWLENYLICYYRTFVGFKDCKGYNCTLGGDGVCGITPMKGKHLSEEHKRKIGKANKGRPHTEEEKKILSEANKGEKNPNYGKPAWNKGIPSDDETKRKISESMKGKPGPNKGKTSHFKGKHHTEESRRKISEAQTGDKNYWYGKHRPKETCIKMSEASKGKHRVYHEDGTFHMER